MVNFSPLAAETGPLVWGTPAISTGFVSWQHYCMALQYWASAKLCGIEQRAPPTFRRTAITLGIGPHSSYVYLVSITLQDTGKNTFPWLLQFSVTTFKFPDLQVFKVVATLYTAKNKRNTVTLDDTRLCDMTVSVMEWILFLWLRGCHVVVQHTTNGAKQNVFILLHFSVYLHQTAKEKVIEIQSCSRPQWRSLW